VGDFTSNDEAIAHWNARVESRNELDTARAVVEAGKDLADVMALEGYTGDTVRDFLKALAAYDEARGQRDYI
jgi:hypothetical protein